MSRSDTFLEKMVNGPRIIIVTGHFGSGKTEFSVSLAYALGELRRAGDERLKELALCDLDIENPYFRSRELTGPLRSSLLWRIRNAGQFLIPAEIIPGR